MSALRAGLEGAPLSDWSRVTRPIPVPNEWTKPFWDAARRGELQLQRCKSCRHFQHPPYATCVRCISTDLAFEPVSGRGAIYAYTIMYHAGDKRFAAAIPYASIIVELDDAPGRVPERLRPLVGDGNRPGHTAPVAQRCAFQAGSRC